MQLRNPSVSVSATVEDVLNSCSSLQDQLRLVEGLLPELREQYAQDFSVHSDYYKKFSRRKVKPEPERCSPLHKSPPELLKYQRNCKASSKLAKKNLDEMLRIFRTSLRKSIMDYHKERGFVGEWYWQKKVEIKK